jgi:hypothetical protein
MAPRHPEWTTTQPFQALLEKDMRTVAAAGKKGLLQIVAATHAGMTIDEFAGTVLDWMASARHPGKPVGINRFIGRRPIFAFGNSDGDLQMLQWTVAGSGPRFAGIVHHTDAEREYAYDRRSMTGRLDKALDEVVAKGWFVVDMKRDWNTVFPN